ncbi:MAG TPA: hypothetical protein VN476_04465, partial [Pyrinomonadaceae bacterium]|nr:hypothetical protein [Pyrinomonadaceae bacterium]
RLAVVVITRGADARNHLPAAVAGRIYSSLSPRFGTQINFQVAQTDDDEATPSKDKKAAVLDEEAQETRAATEAEKAAEEKAAEEKAAETTSGTETGATTGPAAPESKSKVKATVLPVESRPKTTAKPGATPTKPVGNQPTQPKQPD